MKKALIAAILTLIFLFLVSDELLVFYSAEANFLLVTTYPVSVELSSPQNDTNLPTGNFGVTVTLSKVPFGVIKRTSSVDFSLTVVIDNSTAAFKVVTYFFSYTFLDCCIEVANITDGEHILYVEANHAEFHDGNYETLLSGRSETVQFSVESQKIALPSDEPFQGPPVLPQSTPMFPPLFSPIPSQTPPTNPAATPSPSYPAARTSSPVPIPNSSSSSPSQSPTPKPTPETNHSASSMPATEKPQQKADPPAFTVAFIVAIAVVACAIALTAWFWKKRRP